jgi:hypothetical protein
MTGLGAGAICRVLGKSAVTKVAKAGVYLFAIAPFCAPPTCLAFENAAASPPPNNARLISFLSDLDGDRQADSAFAEPQMAPSRPDRYRIEIHLTQGPATEFYLDLSPAGGVRIAARDIDGDDDLDLVVMSRFQQLLGVWINDGHGQFTKGELAGDSLALWQHTARNFEPRGGLSNVPLSICPCNSGMAMPAAVSFRLRFALSVACPERERTAAVLLKSGISLRAPPRC